MALKTVKEGRFRSWDGVPLFFRAWEPPAPANKGLILLHRGHEHTGRLTGLIEQLQLDDFRAFAFDLRGHGQSPASPGGAEDYTAWIRDLDAFVAFISREYGIPAENLAVVANSVGAVTASAWVHDYAPRIRCMILAAPAFRIRLYVPLAVPLLRCLNKLKARAQITSYVKARMLTHDSDEAREYEEDPLITRRISVNVLLGLHDTSTRLLADAGAIHTPTLILTAGADYVVSNPAQRLFFERLSSSMKAMQEYPGLYHALFYEKDRAQPVALARAFILKAFETKVDRSSLIHADRAGHTKQEHDRLLAAPSLAQGFAFRLQRAAMRTVGRLGKGIRLGWETGFNSGRSLDHVYQNRAQGLSPLGRLIDRCYLSAVGWRGIRQRKADLMAALRDAIGTQGASARPVRIMDVAAGSGRYLLETVRGFPEGQVAVLLRDRDDASLEDGRRAAREAGIRNVAFVCGDAFDRPSLAAVQPRPHIVVVSGLYELFPDNRIVLDSLKGIAAALENDGCLIYTGQPWHPQLELIARTLVNADGSPWIMRRRTQAEMDELVRAAGFSKVATRVGLDGMFTVSTARKGVLQ